MSNKNIGITYTVRENGSIFGSSRGQTALMLRKVLEACGNTMRDQIREKHEAQLRAAEESRKELERLKNLARENEEQQKNKQNRRRAEALKLMHETEQVLLDKARAKLSADQTNNEVFMNSALLDTSKGRGKCPW